MGKLRAIFGTGSKDQQSARIVTDYQDAEKAVSDKETRIYITGPAYDELLEAVSEDESLSKWLKGLGSFYMGANGLKHLFHALALMRQANGTLPVSGGEAFFRFAEKFSGEECQNYMARNRREKGRFELVRKNV